MLMSHMFGLFRRRRANGAATHKGVAPPISAELRSAHDREFAEQLHRRLVEKNAGPGVIDKVEPIFKTTNASKPTAAPAARPARPEPEPSKRDAKPSAPQSDSRQGDARKFGGIRIEGPHEPTAATPREPVAPLVQPAGPLINDRPVANDRSAANDQPARPLEPLPALPLVMRAAQFAADRHKAQRRRGAAREPYINHLLEVATLLAASTEGRDPDLVIAGLLHDLIEDQGAGADDIARQFGVGVAALVLEVTSDKSLSEDERNRAHILHAAHKSPRARMLRIADLTSNLRALRQSPPADWSIERQREYFRWAHEVVARSRGLSPQLDAAFDEAYNAGPAPRETAPHDTVARPAAF